MTIRRNVLVATCMVFGFLGAGCKDDDDACADEQAELARLSAEVDALLVAGGCQRVEDCRVAALGASPCGGPTDFAIYCAASTDVAALDERRADLEIQAMRVNEVCELAGPCTILQEPTPELDGDRCVKKTEP